MYSVSLVLSLCCAVDFLLYRFILGYTAIRNQVKFNLFHFFLYLCAFEIAPLLLIYKALLFFFHRMTYLCSTTLAEPHMVKNGVTKADTPGQEHEKNPDYPTQT